MKTDIQMIDCNVDDLIVDRVTRSLDKFGKKYDWVLKAEVFFKKEKNDHDRDKVTEIMLSIPGHDIFVKRKEETFDLSVKRALEGVRHKLKKHKEKIFAHGVVNPIKQ